MDVGTVILFANAPATAMRLRSRGYLDLAAPDPADIRLGDIAGGLAKTCRFGAQLPGWYTVAEHCVHATRLAQARDYHIDVVRAVLLHDASEAYLGDQIRPKRRLVPGFSPIEHAVTTAIFRRFDVGLHWLSERLVSEIDDGLLVAEYSALFDEPLVQPAEEFARVRFQQWERDEAERQFLSLAHEIGIGD